MARSFKRQFQPSIHSFFHRISDTEQGTRGPASPATSSSSSSSNNVNHTTLPHSIQASLLNVGLRIRKSVPEGYKTVSKVFPSSSRSVHAWKDNGSGCWETCARAGSSDFATQYGSTNDQGLMPYCGILKTGDHAAQPVPTEDDVPPLQFDDGWSLPSGSQESQFSSSPAFGSAAAVPVMCPSFSSSFSSVCSSSPPDANGRKRRREDADDGEEELGSGLLPLSPRSRPVSHTLMPNLDQIRPIAVPRSRRKPGFGELGIGSDGVDGAVGRGEIVETEMIDVGDFGEATFLRPQEWGASWG